MRHRRAGRKLNRTTSHRRALFRNLVTALIEHERIRTTDPKAKEVRRIADRMITLGKKGDLHSRRRAAAFVFKRSIVRKLFDEVAPRFSSRPGGYTRVIKVGPRAGDAAPESIVELTERAQTEASEEQPAKRRSAVTAGARKKAASSKGATKQKKAAAQ